jgi:type IV pilus assembly protein PilA
MNKLIKKAERGFTLIELMIVVAIIGILAAVAIPMFLDSMKSAKNSEAKVQLAKMRDTAKTRYATNATFPVFAAVATPGVDCCTQNIGGKKKCKGNKPGDWDVAATWQQLDFQIDEDFYFQYDYTGAAATFTANAVGDMDCDGTKITYTQTGAVVGGNPELPQMIEPAPNSD